MRRNANVHAGARRVAATMAFGAFFLGASPEHIYINRAPIPTVFTNIR